MWLGQRRVKLNRGASQDRMPMEPGPKLGLVAAGACQVSATVLVVDDNAANRVFARATLEAQDYRVIVACTGEEAIASFERERPDCILLDVRMPDLDGPAICRHIRTRPGGSSTSIVFLTAHHDVETFDRALASGGDDFMTKPFQPEHLVVRVESALKLRRLAAERQELYVEIKRQRDDLQRLQLQKEQLISFLVHDLKNPVNAIDLNAQLVSRDNQLGGRSLRAIVKIRDEARAQLRMIMTLLDITRADEGQLAPDREHVDLPALVAEVFEEMQVHADASCVALLCELAAPTLDADRDLLRRVLENLIENAIRYSPEGSEVHVIATRVNTGVEIRVRDRGPGVPAEQIDCVFDRFVQASPSGRSCRGLGLTFCKLVVEAHGGRIWVEDAAPGAVFCLRFNHVDATVSAARTAA